jgi:hypothetical protein
MGPSNVDSGASMLVPVVLASLLAAPASAQDIIGGSTTSDFEAVGQLVVVHDRHGAAPLCSGTLVRDKWLVTAAHCVDGAQDYLDYGFELYFVVGTSLYTDDGIDDYALVINMYGHPSYRGVAHDVAVMELEGDGLPDVPKIALNYDYARSTWAGEDITYVGWGNTNNHGGGAGTKRTVDVPIYYVDGGVIYTWATEGGRNICSGDSGGAALFPDETTGELELVGVNSFGTMAGSGHTEVLCDDPDAVAGVSRIDVDTEWIVGYIGEEPEPTSGEGEGEGESEEEGEVDGETADGEDVADDADVSTSDGKATACSATGGAAGGVAFVLSLLSAAGRRRED